MAVKIGDLIATISLDDKISQPLKQIEQGFGKLAEAGLSGLAIGTGMAVATKAIEGFVGGVHDAVAAIGELGERGEHIAQQTTISGLTNEMVQQLERLAENANSSGDIFVLAFTRMARAAESGSKIFGKLGINLEKFKQMSPAEQMELLAVRITAIESPTERAAAAIALFGRSGAQMLPQLEALAKGADILKVALSDEQIKALSKLDDSLDNTKGAWADLKEQMLAVVATTPEISGAINDLAHVLIALAKGASIVGPELTKVLSVLIRLADLGGALDALKIAASDANLAMLLLDKSIPKATLKSSAAQWYEVSDGMMSAYAQAELLEEGLKKDQKEFKKSQEMAEAAAKGATRAIQEWAETNATLTESLRALNNVGYVLPDMKLKLPEPGVLGDIKAATQAAYENLLKMAEAAAKSGLGAEQIQKKLEGAGLSSAEIASIMPHVAAAIAHAAEESNTWGRVLGTTLSDAVRGLPNIIVGAIQGGGDVFKASGAFVGGKLGQAIGDKIGGPNGVLTKALGSTLGSALGSLAGPIGSALGSLAGKALDKLASAFHLGGNKVIMQVNDMRDAFFEAQGGFEAFSEKMAAVSDEDWAKKIFDAKTVEEFNALVTEAKSLLDLQGEAQQSLNDAMDRYGITIEELGPKFAQQELDKQAAQLLQDWKLLGAAGVDVNTLIDKMGPSMNEFVNQAIAAGATIPEALRPSLDAMFKAGKLLHEDGTAFTEAEYKALSFGQTQEEMFTSLIEKIDKMINALLGIPDVDFNVTQHNRTEGESDQHPSHPGGEGPPGMAAGGIVTSPTIAMIGESGPEAVIPLGALGNGAGSVDLLASMLSELRSLNGRMSNLSELTRRSVRDGIALAPR